LPVGDVVYYDGSGAYHAVVSYVLSWKHSSSDSDMCVRSDLRGSANGGTRREMGVTADLHIVFHNSPGIHDGAFADHTIGIENGGGHDYGASIDSGAAGNDCARMYEGQEHAATLLNPERRLLASVVLANTQPDLRPRVRRQPLERPKHRQRKHCRGSAPNIVIDEPRESLPARQQDFCHNFAVSASSIYHDHSCHL